MADTLAGHDPNVGKSIPYPEDDGALWDRVKLGPYVLPGTWTVGGGVDRRIDVKKSKGADGARFRDQGYLPAPITLTGTLIGATDWNEMGQALKGLTPRKRGVSLDPLAVEHPAFTMLGITNVLVKKVSAPQLNGGQIRISIDVLEWFSKPKPKKPAQIITPISAFATGQLQREARATPWQLNPADSFDQENLSFSGVKGLRPGDDNFSEEEL